MNRIIISFLFLVTFLSAQTETQKWTEKEVDFRIQQTRQKEYIINSSDISTLLISTARITYYKIFSDYDGDNCPFHPSCSAFFVKAVEQTNLVQGSLMFADRFTRDLNFFKSLDSYPIHSSGKFHDPVDKYILSSSSQQKDNHSDE